jgi:hypothetical protein
MARCWGRLVASLVVLCVCTAGLQGSRPAGGIGFTYLPATCVPTITFCAPYTRRNICVVRKCGNRVSGSVSGSASGGSGTNIHVSGRFVPKYTDRFSTWRGLRYGKCYELEAFRFQNTWKSLSLTIDIKLQGLLINWFSFSALEFEILQTSWW